MRRHRTTARGLFVLTLLAGIASAAATALAADPLPPPPPPPPSAQDAKGKLVFPIVGKVAYSDDFGDPRGQGRHEGNDIVAPRRAVVVAVEAGRVKFHTTSSRAGCMLYLYGASGTTYLYIHLNNDLTTGNDNRGRCEAGVAYAPGLKSGQKVAAGEPIGYVGDSGDANGIHPHLHFELRPNGGAAISPYRALRAATPLLFAARPGSTFTLAVTGTVTGVGDGKVEVRAEQVRHWPGGRRTVHDGRVVSIDVPVEAELDGQLADLIQAPVVTKLAKPLRATVFTEPGKVSLAALGGAPGALFASRVVRKT